ncbi:uncharacterized protein LOC142338658 isoform X2 [Convolutriloba macropyga]|uniref:uncharacterized protein LOC142338658 isoform X2 n=1 Tax=Convolutriloba macropyga TaxID=536237 RepID=UPI003F51DA4A
MHYLFLLLLLVAIDNCIATSRVFLSVENTENATTFEVESVIPTPPDGLAGYRYIFQGRSENSPEIHVFLGTGISFVDVRQSCTTYDVISLAIDADGANISDASSVNTIETGPFVTFTIQNLRVTSTKLHFELIKTDGFFAKVNLQLNQKVSDDSWDRVLQSEQTANIFGQENILEIILEKQLEIGTTYQLLSAAFCEDFQYRADQTLAEFTLTSTVAELQSELTSSTSEIDQSRSTTTSSSSVVVKQTSQSAKSTIFSKTTSTSVAGQATHQTSKEPSETTRSRSEFDLSTTSAQLHSDVPSSTSKLAPSDFTTSPKGTVSVLSSTESEAVASTSNVISEKTDSNSGSVTSATTTNPEGTNVTTISGTDGTATTVEFKDPSRTSAASSATDTASGAITQIGPETAGIAAAQTRNQEDQTTILNYSQSLASATKTESVSSTAITVDSQNVALSSSTSGTTSITGLPSSTKVSTNAPERENEFKTETGTEVKTLTTVSPLITELDQSTHQFSPTSDVSGDIQSTINVNNGDQITSNSRQTTQSAGNVVDPNPPETELLRAGSGSELFEDMPDWGYLVMGIAVIIVIISLISCVAYMKCRNRQSGLFGNQRRIVSFEQSFYSFGHVNKTFDSLTLDLPVDFDESTQNNNRLQTSSGYVSNSSPKNSSPVTKRNPELIASTPKGNDVPKFYRNPSYIGGNGGGGVPSTLLELSLNAEIPAVDYSDEFKSQYFDEAF